MICELKFELPGEAEEFQAAVDGSKWKSVVFDVDQILRNKEKYGTIHVITIESVRKIISETIYNYELHGE